MADNDVLNAQVGQHVSADLAGVSTGLLEVDILGADMDVGALGLGNGRDQIGERHADNDLAASVLDGGDQGVDQLGGLGGGLIHFPVAGNDCLAVLLIHDVTPL